MARTFFYFGFGSNMLAKRIHINNPTAKQISAGKLLNYRLDFNVMSDQWRGAAATIVPTENAIVYGTIWEIAHSDLKSLDRQEGVSSGIYVPVHVPIINIHNDCTIECRAYHLTQQPDSDIRQLTPDKMPITRQPSKTYLKTLVKGALESGIPMDYVNWLRSLKHNGKMVDKFEQHLELADVVLGT